MNKYAVIVLLVLAVLISFWLGKKLYKVTHEGFIRDNVSVLVFQMRYELQSLDSLLVTLEENKDKATLYDEVKKKLLKRRNQLVNNLNLFYGNNVFS